tara:strand:+ start:33 stop:527 length:495 start_codon:yes stop_codon:yes gene_type:complete
MKNKQLYKYEKIVYTQEEFQKLFKVVKPLCDMLFELTPSLKTQNWSSSHQACASLGNLALYSLRNSNKKVLYWEAVKKKADPSHKKDEKGENDYTVANRNFKYNSANSQDYTKLDQLMTHCVEHCIENLHIRKEKQSQDVTPEQRIAEEKQLEAENKKLINFNI